MTGLVEIEIPGRPCHRLLGGLLERLVEATGQRIVSPLFGLHRLLKQRLATGVLGSQDASGLVKLRLVASLRLTARHDPPEIAVDHERRPAAGTRQLELALQFRHDVPMIQPPA